MNKTPDVNTEIEVNAPVRKVWNALTTRESLKQFMLGADITSDWKEGSPIVWAATVNGVKYEDKGTVLKVVPEQILQYSHYSDLTGRPDLPGNYHIITITLSNLGDITQISVSQSNNASDAEFRHNFWGWNMILGYLKRFVEK